MAVVQISRIQIRRGQANGGTGLPQLASGELAWALDTQELYIGNGSISEGAPYVGNTKVLTEHDNILDLAAVYQYKKNDTSIVTGEGDLIQRSLQERLDDIVSVRAFGAVGDGFVDDTRAIQRAIDQLYINDASKYSSRSRITLYFEAGTYIISDEIKIPPYAHLIGEGIDSTIIRQVSADVHGSAVFRMVDGNSTPGNYTAFGNMIAVQRPRFITIKGMTLENTTSRSVVLSDNVDSSIFEEVKFIGNYANGTSPTVTVAPGIDDTQSGVFMRSNSIVFCNNNVLFKFCIFNATGYGVFSNTESNYVKFESCTFFQLFDGITIGGADYGAVGSVIESSYFDQIDRYGIWIKDGTKLNASVGNTSRTNKFFKVGNNNNSYDSATYPIIKFDKSNNVSSDDYFERNFILKDQTHYGLNPFLANIQSRGLVVDNYNYVIDIIESGNPVTDPPVPAIRFPVSDSCTFEIDYVINKFQGTSGGRAIRTGVLHVTVNVGASLTDGNNPPSYHIHDDFGYTGDIAVEYIKFSASLYGFAPAATMVDTLVINYTNPKNNGLATLNYTYKVLNR